MDELIDYLVVSTHLKNMLVKLDQNIWNHHLEDASRTKILRQKKTCRTTKVQILSTIHAESKLLRGISIPKVARVAQLAESSIQKNTQ